MATPRKRGRKTARPRGTRVKASEPFALLNYTTCCGLDLYVVNSGGEAKQLAKHLGWRIGKAAEGLPPGYPAIAYASNPDDPWLEYFTTEDISAIAAVLQMSIVAK